jgi:hypothetical protein
MKKINIILFLSFLGGLLLLQACPQKPVSERIFTVYFLGTGISADDYNSSHYWDGETVATLGKVKQLGTDHIDYLIVDGPGGDGRRIGERFVHFEQYVLQSKGGMIGTGVLENIANVIAVMKLKNENPKLNDLVSRLKGEIQDRNLGNIAKVNVVGFSRGAVSAIVFARELERDVDFKNVAVNIFAIDPVAGPGWTKDVFHLSTNVYDFVGAYAQNEYSTFFEAIVPVVTPGNHVTRITYLSFPGKHGSLAGADYQGKLPGNPNLRSSGKVVRHLAERFLLQHGSQLKNTVSLSKADLLQEYAAMQANRSAYNELGIQVTYTSNGFGSGFGSGNSERAAHVGSANGSYEYSTVMSAVQEPIGFINAHHKELQH